MRKKIKVNDKVIVIAGNYKGSSGKIISRSGDKVTVEGINIKKKCLKKSQDNPSGRIIDIERPIHISNVQVCVEDKPVKLFTKMNKHQEKELCYATEDGKSVVYRNLKGKR